MNIVSGTKDFLNYILVSGSVCRVISSSVGNNFGQIFGDATVVYFVHNSEFRQFPPIWKWLPACLEIQRFFKAIIVRPVTIRAANYWTFSKFSTSLWLQPKSSIFKKRPYINSVHFWKSIFCLDQIWVFLGDPFFVCFIYDKINKRSTGHIAHLRKKFKSINTYDFFITLIKRRKKKHYKDNKNLLVLHLKKLNPYHARMLVPRLVKIGSVVLEMRIF